MKSVAALAAAAMLGSLATLALTPSTASARKRVVIEISNDAPDLTHGDWQRVDGGYKLTACGHVNRLDGGIVRLNSDCVPCEVAQWRLAPAVCLAAWQKANELVP